MSTSCYPWIARAAGGRLLGVLALVALSLFSLSAAEVPKTFGEFLYQAGRTSVWRVNPSDYFFAEARFGEWFSLTNDVVFAHVDEEGVPHFAVALNRRTDRSYTVSLYDYYETWDRSADVEMRRRTVALDGRIGRKIESAVNLQLHGLVLLSPKPLDSAHLRHGAWWVFRRNPANQVESAMIATYAGSHAPALLGGIVRDLFDYVETNPDNRKGIGEEMEAAADGIIRGRSS